MKEEWMLEEIAFIYVVFDKFKGENKIRYIEDKLHGKLVVFYFWKGKVLR